MKKKVLILGRIPPPLGGVTIHVSRLLDCLERDNIDYQFINLIPSNIGLLIRGLFETKSIHIHSSNPFIRLGIILAAKVFRKPTMLTLHGNLGRHGWFKNRIDYYAVTLCTHPILINKGSYKKGKQLNKNALLISAFIPPVYAEPLTEDSTVRIERFTSKFEKNFCTNASALTYDKAGKEIYGVTELVKVFKEIPQYGLIFSDPSKAYSDYWTSIGFEIPENVLVLDFPHAFVNIIKKTDVLLRTTTTDGDSLTIREAIYYDKQVICSDCVSRPKPCVMYRTHNSEDLKDKILSTIYTPIRNSESTSGYPSVKQLYLSV